MTVLGVATRSRHATNPILHQLHQSAWGWHTACNGGRAHPVDPTRVVGRACTACASVAHRATPDAMFTKRKDHTMPQPTRGDFTSDIVLGEKYVDKQTHIEGTATAVTFFQHACERVQIELVLRDGKLAEYVFDAPRLTHIESGKQATSKRTGGPDHSVHTQVGAQRGSLAR